MTPRIRVARLGYNTAGTIHPRSNDGRGEPGSGENGVALIDKQGVVGLDGVAHLATGGEAPWLRSRDDAGRRFGRFSSRR